MITDADYNYADIDGYYDNGSHIDILPVHINRLMHILSFGLSNGLGSRRPGKMCVEAAVCLAFGWPHDAEPKCVNAGLRGLKICINDTPWFSDEIRGDALKRFALAQLGTRRNKKNKFSFEEFNALMYPLVIARYGDDFLKRYLPFFVTNYHFRDNTVIAMKKALTLTAGSPEWYNALKGATPYGASDPLLYLSDQKTTTPYLFTSIVQSHYHGDADDFIRHKAMWDFCELCVQTCIKMNTAGCEFLDRAPFEELTQAKFDAYVEWHKKGIIRPNDFDEKLPKLPDADAA